MNNIVNFILENDNFVITCHVHPDGDAIGSSIALYLALKKIGKKVDMVIEDVPKTFKYLVGYDDIKLNSDNKYDVGLILDNADISRINKSNIISNINTMVVIDHHISNTNYGDINYVLGLSSCSMVIYELIKNLNIIIDKDIANAIYTGLITDTGCYKNKNVNSETFVASSELCKIVDVPYIIKNAVGTISRSEFMLRKIGMDRLELFYNNQIGVIKIYQDDIVRCNANYDECASLVNIPREIEGVEVSVLIRYFDNETRVSLRSNYIDVNEIAKTFGCGGHKNAAGIGLKADIDKKEFESKLLSVIENSINEWNNSCK